MTRKSKMRTQSSLIPYSLFPKSVAEADLVKTLTLLCSYKMTFSMRIPVKPKSPAFLKRAYLRSLLEFKY
jgi:hypothetical protein